MSNKNRRIIIITFIISLLVIIGILFILKENTNSELSNSKLANNNNNIIEENREVDENSIDILNKNVIENNEASELKKYDEQFNKLAVNETNGEKEKTIITIVNKESIDNKKIEVTNKDLEFFKTMLAYGNNDATDEELKEEVLDYKIYSAEAQSLKLEIPSDRMEDIEEMSNSDEILGFIQNDKKAKNNFKERVYNYLLDIEYNSVLRNRILDEISNNKISITNELISNKMEEYMNVKEEFTNIESPTEDDKKQSFAKSLSLYYEMEKLYLNVIKDKYIVDNKY